MTSVNETHIFDIYNIQSSLAERFLMGFWCVLTTSISLSGNCLVLIASHKYDVIKLDKVSTILIKNIAVADLGFALMIIFTLITIIQDTWIFGTFICEALNYINIFLGISEVNLICALNISKLHCLLFPFQARLRSVRTGHLIAFSMWSIMPIFHFIPSIMLGRKVAFRLSYYRCEGYFEGAKAMFPMFSGVLFIILPLLTVLMVIIWLLYYVRGVRGLQKQRILILLLISLCYFCSYLPFGIYHIVKATVPGLENNISISIYFYRFAIFIIYLNFSANPIIYIFSVKSFKYFVANLCTNNLRRKHDFNRTAHLSRIKDFRI